MIPPREKRKFFFFFHLNLFRITAPSLSGSYRGDKPRGWLKIWRYFLQHFSSTLNICTNECRCLGVPERGVGRKVCIKMCNNINLLPCRAIFVYGTLFFAFSPPHATCKLFAFGVQQQQKLSSTFPGEAFYGPGFRRGCSRGTTFVCLFIFMRKQKSCTMLSYVFCWPGFQGFALFGNCTNICVNLAMECFFFGLLFKWIQLKLQNVELIQLHPVPINRWQIWTSKSCPINRDL